MIVTLATIVPNRTELSMRAPARRASASSIGPTTSKPIPSRTNDGQAVASAPRHNPALVWAAPRETGSAKRPVLQVAVSRIGGSGGDQTVIESFTGEFDPSRRDHDDGEQQQTDQPRGRRGGQARQLRA